MPVFIAFLRGINVGGNKTIKMAALKALFETELGFVPVKTLLNSGNVVFAAKGTRATLVKTIEAAIEKAFGFRPAVVIRSAAELKTILAKNPFPKMAKHDPSHLVVMGLAQKAKAGAKARVAKTYAGPEEIAVKGADVYLTYPNGIGRSKLTNALLEKHLGAVGTARNWSTLTKLLGIADTLEKA